MLDGKLRSCTDYAPICKFRCCDQDMLEPGVEFKPTDYIMMYPGEYNAEDPLQAHLMLIAKHQGGTLNRCKKECFDQSQCSPDVNYKPLDCRSYPFMPAIVNRKLVLVEDNDRCPLQSVDIEVSHQEEVKEAWEKVCTDNTVVMNWINSLLEEGDLQ